MPCQMGKRRAQMAFLLKFWRQREITHKMRDTNIVTLYKNRGGNGDCYNYRETSLLSVAGKIFAMVLLKRLQWLADRFLPDTQSGFRAGRSTTEMIFTLRHLQGKYREQRKPLFINFVVLTKVFDTVSRKSLHKVLEKIGCPPLLLQLIISFHEDTIACIQFDRNTSVFRDEEWR